MIDDLGFHAGRLFKALMLLYEMIMQMAKLTGIAVAYLCLGYILYDIASNHVITNLLKRAFE